jgi:hypothetical protein
MNSITWLQQWYANQCDDDWEHRFGITIQTLDNPGWLVTVDLTGTAMQGIGMKEVGQLSDINHSGFRGKHDWLHCKVEEDRFLGAGGPFSLLSICDVFKRWIEETIEP